MPEAGFANVTVFLSQWRDSNSTGAAYDQLAARISILLKIAENLGSYDLDALEAVETFQDVEKRMTSLLRDRVTEDQDTLKSADVHRLVNRRLDSHWVSANLPDHHATPRSAFRSVYSNAFKDSLGLTLVHFSLVLLKQMF